MPHTNKGGGRWRFDHDPFARPLGCNGKYGGSGVQKHRHYGTPPCKDCLESIAHYKRERRRGGLKPKQPAPCGTYGGAAQHKAKKEPTCFKCRVAEAAYRAEHRSKQREAVPTGAASVIQEDS